MNGLYILYLMLDGWMVGSVILKLFISEAIVEPKRTI